MKPEASAKLQDITRPVRKHMIERGKTNEEVNRYLHELLEPAVTTAMTMHYKQGKTSDDVDDWYVAEVRRLLVEAGYVSLLPPV